MYTVTMQINKRATNFLDTNAYQHALLLVKQCMCPKLHTLAQSHEIVNTWVVGIA